MTDIQAVFLPLGRTTFHMESATACFEQSRALVKELAPKAACPSELLTSPEMLADYLAGVKNTLPAVAIVQTTTFVDSTFMALIARELSCPIILWGVREPAVDGGRLRLNSMTGVYAAGNVLNSLGRKFKFVFGSAADADLKAALNQELAGLLVAQQLRSLKIGVVGHFPSGFFFSNLEDVDVMRHVGPQIVRMEAREIINRAVALTAEEIAPTLAEVKTLVCGLDQVDPVALEKYARLHVAYQRAVADNGCGAMATRCWPDFFNEYGAAVCGAISVLTEKGVVTSCEADIGGAISMYISRQLSGNAPFFGDPVHLDEASNTFVYWHCGAGACSIASPSTGACAGVHPNRKLGMTMEFAGKGGRATVLRLGKTPEGYRMFIMGGEALDEPKKFLGTSVTVRPDQNAASILAESVEQGWEAHFVVAYGDIRQEVKALCRWLDIPVVEF